MEYSREIKDYHPTLELEYDEKPSIADELGWIALNNHHVFFPRRVHEVYPESKFIRDAVIAKDLWVPKHTELHKNVSAVPLLEHYMLSRVANRMQRHYDDPIKGIDDFSYAVENASMHHHCREHEKELGQMAIDIVRSQVPYILQGQIK